MDFDEFVGDQIAVVNRRTAGAGTGNRAGV